MSRIRPTLYTRAIRAVIWCAALAHIHVRIIRVGGGYAAVLS